MKFNKILPLILCTSLFLASACTKKSENGENQGDATSDHPVAVQATPTANASQTPGDNSADLTVDNNGLSKTTVVVKTSKGVLKFKFYAKDAPNTVKRFVELVQQKFYNGLSFHRVVDGFVAQTGDPKSRNKSDPTIGTGGSGQKLKAEFNSRKHIRGTVAMARSADVDSADSQFYFTRGVFPHLDEKYTVIGHVVDFGEKVGDKDVLDRISQGDDLVEITLE